VKDYKVKPHPCDGCGKVLDGATIVMAENSPKPGDLTVCAYCGLIACYTDDLQTRPATGADLLKLDPGPRATLERIAEALRKRPFTAPKTKEN
jgi:hypothetical protein